MSPSLLLQPVGPWRCRPHTHGPHTLCGSLTFPTHACTHAGDHWLHDFFEELLADLWAMVARALSVSVMVLWYDTS